MDPEATSISDYPVMRNFSFGLNITIQLYKKHLNIMKSKHIIAITALTFASLTSCTSVLDKDDLTAVSEKGNME